jgi:membrane protein DedA with SNARE-associated domain
MKIILDKYGPFIIFFFALTPLPDDVIYPVLGIMKYNFIKVFTSCFLGKTILSAVVVYAGYFSTQYIKTFLGGESQISSIIAVLIGILLAIIILKVDWTRYINIEGKKGG